jgi:murein DD-endopeptidase MepM/ murein hydrolase activator NlpD
VLCACSTNPKHQPIGDADASASAAGTASQVSTTTGEQAKLHQDEETVSTDQYQATLSSKKVPDGSLLVVTMKFNHPWTAPITGKFEDQSFQLFPSPDLGANTYEAVFGVPHSHKPGPAQLALSSDGLDATLPFDIVDAHYKSETLKVAPGKVNPPKKELPRIFREIKEVAKIYKIVTPKKYWTGPFLFPIQSQMTSPFGTKRLYNGQLKSFHGGLDLRAPMGTPIHSAAPGKVLLAKNLYYSGNTVILDHGYGVMTLYFHMSKIKVKRGQVVGAGQLLGLSGKTGRVTGPHLHWQAMIHKVKVNPLGLVEVLK